MGAVEVESYSFLTSTQNGLSGQLHATCDIPSGENAVLLGPAADLGRLDREVNILPVSEIEPRVT